MQFTKPEHNAIIAGLRLLQGMLSEEEGVAVRPDVRSNIEAIYQDGGESIDRKHINALVDHLQHHHATPNSVNNKELASLRLRDIDKAVDIIEVLGGMYNPNMKDHDGGSLAAFIHTLWKRAREGELVSDLKKKTPPIRALEDMVENMIHDMQDELASINHDLNEARLQFENIMHESDGGKNRIGKAEHRATELRRSISRLEKTIDEL